MAEFTLRSTRVRDNAIEHIQALPLEPIMRVTIKPYTKNRTNAQNNLMWLWHTQYSKEFGFTKKETHKQFKREYVLPILLRDDDDHQLHALYQLASGNPPAMEAFVGIISTTHLDTKQFSEALNDYDMQTALLGFAFPHPSDMYHEAMA